MQETTAWRAELCDAERAARGNVLIQRLAGARLRVGLCFRPQMSRTVVVGRDRRARLGAFNCRWNAALVLLEL